MAKTHITMNRRKIIDEMTQDQGLISPFFGLLLMKVFDGWDPRTRFGLVEPARGAKPSLLLSSSCTV